MATLLDRLRNGTAARLCRESLGDRADPPPAAPVAAPANDPEAGWTRDRARGVMLLELSRIRPDANQPRKHFDADELDRLAGSVRARGILQPVRVRWDGEWWILVAGECRYRSAIAAGLNTVPAMRIEGLATAADVLEDQIAEQLLRSTWSPIEEAKALRCLSQARGWENWQLCKALHLEPSKVSRSLALLELSEAVQELVGYGDGKLAPRAAIELRKLDSAQQLAVAQAAIGEKLNVAETVERVAAVRGKPDRPPRIPHQRRVFKVAGLVVSVKLPSPDTPDAEILAALEQLVGDLRRALPQAA